MAGEFVIKKAARIIQAGGIVAYPTEAVYGLGCDPLNLETLLELVAIKGRNLSKGFILIAAEIMDLLPFLAPMSEDIYARVAATTQSPVTWVLPADSTVPELLTGGRDTLAVRVTAHPVAAALCRAVGFPLVSTSANRSGHTPARNAHAVRHVFGELIDFVLPGSVGPLTQPTPLRDGVTGKILRSG